MKEEATRWINECAYCSRQLKERDDYMDLSPSGPVFYYPKASARAAQSLPVFRVVCMDCQERRARLFALGDFGEPVAAGQDLGASFDGGRAGF